jgi:hypothetical protein
MKKIKKTKPPPTLLEVWGKSEKEIVKLITLGRNKWYN